MEKQNRPECTTLSFTPSYHVCYYIRNNSYFPVKIKLTLKSAKASSAACELKQAA